MRVPRGARDFCRMALRGKPDGENIALIGAQFF